MYHIHILHGQTELEVIDIRLVSSCCGGDAIAIGAVCAAELTVRAYGQMALTDELITASVQRDQEAAVALGTYRVASCRQEGDTTTITAYDAAYYALGAEYVPNDQTPPATALAVLADICGQTGLTLGSTAGLTDQPVTGDLTGHTCREMAGYMAALLGCNALIGRGGSLELRWFDDSGAEVTADDYYSGGLSLEGTSTLAGVRMSKKVTAQDGTEETVNYDAGSGSGTVIAVENPYATQTIVDAVWTKIGGLGSYRTGQCTLFGGLLIEPGDIVTITDRDGVSATVPVMSVTLELDGGCKCTLESAGKSETAVAANVQGPTGRALTKLAADIGEFKRLYADSMEAITGKFRQIYAEIADIDIAKIGGFIVQDRELYSDGTYENDGGFEVDTSLHLRAANAGGNNSPPSLVFAKVHGLDYADYDTLAELTVGGGGTRATGVSAFDWVKLGATDVEQGLETFIKLWAKDNKVEIAGDVEIPDSLSVQGKSIVVSSGAITFTSIICAGLISGGQTSLQFFVPSSRVLVGTASCTALSVVVRHGGGGYAYARSGANGATYTPLGSGLTSIWANGVTVRAGEVTSVACTNRTDGVQINVTFGYQLATASGDPTAVTNNIPAAVSVSATIVFS